jgi:hypothetical protein
METPASQHPVELAPAGLPEPTESILTEVVMLQSLLAQFAHPQVRADLVAGLFGFNINSSILPVLDELRWTLFPRWRGGGFEMSRATSRAASQHLQLLIAKSEKLLITNYNSIDLCLTYSEWYHTLETLASDRYWDRVPSDDRCTHILPEIGELHLGAASDAHTQRVGPTHPAIGKHDTTSPSTSRSNQKMKHKRDKAVKIEEIVLSSSDATSNSSCAQAMGDSSSDYSSDSEGPSLPYNLHRRWKHLTDRREVVVPPKFNMFDKQHLKDYLTAFESYFEKKFKGSTYDKTQKLAEFLEGDLLTVYHVRGGRKLKYEEMKKELIAYYKKQRLRGKRYWRGKLAEATPELGEGYDIFGMRLVELASLAFPKDKKESAMQLRQHFLKAMPPSIAAKILDAERAMKATSSAKRKHLNFSSLVQMARDLQEERPKSLLWTAHSSAATQGKPHGMPGNPRTFAGQHDRSSGASLPGQPGKCQATAKSAPPPPGKSSKGASVKDLRSNYCRKPNHLRRDCWRASKLCLICGGGHHIKNCPSYDAKYLGKSKSAEVHKSEN